MYEPIFYGDVVNMTEYEKSLYVVSCGAYLFKKNNAPRLCHRPEGRSDYHFICVTSGKSECVVDGKSYVLSRGDAVFYSRNATQFYKHSPTDEGTEIYWIHFDGHDADALLGECGFDKSHVFSFSCDVKPMFEKILNELINKDNLYMKSAASTLYELTVALSRERLPKNVRDDKIESVIRMMNDIKCKTSTLSEYASVCSLSVPQFIKRFTKYTGLSPMKYRMQRVLNAAVTYVENTDMSIKEISEILGFENSYYFSNCFKKHTGLSPKVYRDNMRQKK